MLKEHARFVSSRLAGPSHPSSHSGRLWVDKSPVHVRHVPGMVFFHRIEGHLLHEPLKGRRIRLPPLESSAYRSVASVRATHNAETSNAMSVLRPLQERHTPATFRARPEHPRGRHGPRGGRGRPDYTPRGLRPRRRRPGLSQRKQQTKVRPVRLGRRRQRRWTWQTMMRDGQERRGRRREQRVGFITHRLPSMPAS